MEEQARQALTPVCGEDQEREQAAWMRDDAKTILADAKSSRCKTAVRDGRHGFFIVWSMVFSERFQNNITHRKQRSLQ
jgi:hypothetical protein